MMNYFLSKSFLKYLVLALCFPLAKPYALADTKVSFQDEINHLLNFVKNSDCLFIRNKKIHHANEAYLHIVKKYEHFRDEIDTAEAFIEKSATGSLISGKKYHVTCPEQKNNMYSSDWLNEELKLYRSTKKN